MLYALERPDITEGSMMRKTIIALFALAAVGLVQPTVASARGGGGGGGGHGGGGGGHGGGFGGGGFHGGGGGGWHGGGGGGWHGGGMAWHGGRVAAIGAGAGFAAGRFHHGFHHRRVFFVGAGPYAYYDDYPYYYDDSYYGDGSGCYIVRQRVLTRHGWRVRPVQVCG